MDLETLRGWLVQGLVTEDAEVKPPGSANWKRLGSVLNQEEPARKGGRPAAARSPAARPTAFRPSKPARPAAPRPAAAKAKSAPAQRRASRAPKRSGGGGKVFVLLLLLAALGGGAWAVFHFGLLPLSQVAPEVSAWVAADNRYSNDVLGLRVEPSGGWRVLKDEQTVFVSPFVPPVATQLSLAHETGTGFAALTAVTAPGGGIFSSEDYLEQRHPGRRRSGFKLGRSAPLPGPLPGHKAEATFEADGKRFREITAVWKNGRSYVVLTAWGSAGGRGASALDALPASVRFDAARVKAMTDGLAAVTRELPHLTPAAAEAVMDLSAAERLDAPETFRRASQFVGRGLTSLSEKEVKELRNLNAAVYKALSSKDKRRLAAYFERLRGGRPTPRHDDERMSSLMKTGTLELSDKNRARLQALYEKAIRAGVRSAR